MPHADLIITNARVITMDKEHPFAEALAVSGNRILAVGTSEAMKDWRGPKTRVHDNKANTVIPGIIEIMSTCSSVPSNSICQTS